MSTTKTYKNITARESSFLMNLIQHEAEVEMDEGVDSVTCQGYLEVRPELKPEDLESTVETVMDVLNALITAFKERKDVTFHFSFTDEKPENNFYFPDEPVE